MVYICLVPRSALALLNHERDIPLPGLPQTFARQMKHSRTQSSVLSFFQVPDGSSATM